MKHIEKSVPTDESEKFDQSDQFNRVGLLEKKCRGGRKQSQVPLLAS